MSEPRTNLEIWRDALDMLREREFYEGFDDRYSESYLSCASCSVKKWTGAFRRGRDDELEHKNDCRLARTLRELEAFIAAEERLEEEREAAGAMGARS